MLDEIWSFALNQLHHNTFLTGGGLLMAVGGIAAACRHWPHNLFWFLVSRCVLTVEVTEKDQAFNWLAKWLSTQQYSKTQAKRLALMTMPVDAVDERRKSVYILTPAPGRHYFRHKGRWVSLEYSRSNSSESSSSKGKDSFKLSVLTRSRQVIFEMVEEARLTVEKPDDDRQIIWVYSKYNGWTEAQRKHPRPIDSVILRPGVMERIVADLELFKRSEDKYKSRGIPYRRAYLLYGPPGTGKSSTAFSIASHFRMDMAVINLNESGLNDQDVRNCLTEIPPNTIGLIEDVDSVFNHRVSSNGKNNDLTFAGLLNALDGVASSESRILFITTNHRERLDPALLRAGRCDMHAELGLSGQVEAQRIFDRFFPGSGLAGTFASFVPESGICMAAVQGVLCECGDSPDIAVEKMRLLCSN